MSVISLFSNRRPACILFMMWPERRVDVFARKQDAWLRHRDRMRGERRISRDPDNAFGSSVAVSLQIAKPPDTRERLANLPGVWGALSGQRRIRVDGILEAKYRKEYWLGWPQSVCNPLELSSWRPGSPPNRRFRSGNQQIEQHPSKDGRQAPPCSLVFRVPLISVFGAQKSS